jgi:cysteine-S-conjugate beta-lyase
MSYNFDEIIDRDNTQCEKYDGRPDYFGTSDVLPLWVADMDFKTPDFIINTLKKRLSHPILGYMKFPEEFRDSVASWMLHRHSWKIDPSDIKLVPGVVPGLNLAIMAFSNPGDKIIIQPPVYPPFFGAVTNNDRKLLLNPLQFKHGRYHFDFDDLEKKIDRGTRMLLLCNPHNPGGSVWTKEELLKLTDICSKHNIIIVSDEIHADVIYNGFHHTPLASVSETAANISVTLMSPSKTFNIAGLATAEAIIPNHNLMNQFYLTLNKVRVGYGNIFGIEALISAYTYGEEWLTELLLYLENNVNYAFNYISSEIPMIKPVKPEGTFLLWLNCENLNMNPAELKHFFIEKCHVGLNNGSDFGKEGNAFMRMNLGCPKKLLTEALQRMETAIKLL